MGQKRRWHEGFRCGQIIQLPNHIAALLKEVRQDEEQLSVWMLFLRPPRDPYPELLRTDWPRISKTEKILLTAMIGSGMRIAHLHWRYSTEPV